MKIDINEIDTVEEAGTLFGSVVKLLRTKGGFWMGVSKLKNKAREEVIAAGSHPAIVKFNIEKAYPEFQPTMMKSELLSDNTVVEKHSHFLSDELRKSGHDIYSIQDGLSVNFHISKHGMKVSDVDGFLRENALVIKELSIPKEFTRALAGAVTEKALSCKANKIKMGE